MKGREGGYHPWERSISPADLNLAHRTADYVPGTLEAYFLDVD